MGEIDSEKKARLAAQAALDKKADRLVILEMKDIFPICDYFIICSGDSTRQVRAIAENIQQKLSEHRFRHWHVEGLRESHWVLLDYNDVVIHIFLSDVRDFYNLEHLWADAPKVEP